MGESTEDGGKGGIPSDGPITMCLDNFRRFPPTNGQVKIPNGCCGLASRLTTILERTSFHSDLGKGRRELEDWSDQSVCLRSAV